MKPETRRTASIAAAACLAFLTLAVFVASQYGGPASAVSRYHQGLLRRDRALMESVTRGNSESPAARVLRNYVGAVLGSGTHPVIVQTVKDGNRAVVVVEYVARQQRINYVPFEMQKLGGVWLVDPATTVARLAPRP